MCIRDRSGLHPAGQLSEHLASRVEVGDILLASPVETVVLQAGVVLGSGSASFDMLRHLTERLPAMFGPKWLRNRIQPIAIGRGVDLAELPLAELQALNASITADVADVLTLRGSLNARNVTGGTAPAQVQRQIERHRTRLSG